MIVQKFGGTSVADPAAVGRLIEIVRAARARDGRGPVVVVSALSGVTDALLHVAVEAGASRVESARAGVERLRARHLAMARALAGERALATLTSQIDEHFDELTAVVKALAVLREVSLRTLDVVGAVGELLSSRIVAAALLNAGMPGEWVDARRAIVTSGEHTRAVPLVPETRAALRAAVVPVVEAGRIPVLGGFLGATGAGRRTTASPSGAG